MKFSATTLICLTLCLSDTFAVYMGGSPNAGNALAPQNAKGVAAQTPVSFRYPRVRMPVHHYNGREYENFHIATNDIIRRGAITEKDIQLLRQKITLLEYIEPALARQFRTILSKYPVDIIMEKGIQPYLRFLRDMTKPGMTDKDRVSVILHYAFSSEFYSQTENADKYLKNQEMASRIKRLVRPLESAFGYLYGMVYKAHGIVPEDTVDQYKSAAWELIREGQVSDAQIQEAMNKAPKRTYYHGSV